MRGTLRPQDRCKGNRGERVLRVRSDSGRWGEPGWRGWVLAVMMETGQWCSSFVFVILPHLSLAITDEERRRVFGTVEGIYGWEGKRTVRYTVAGRKRG